MMKRLLIGLCLTVALLAGGCEALYHRHPDFGGENEHGHFFWDGHVH